jgi:hypothetical protein
VLWHNLFLFTVSVNFVAHVVLNEICVSGSGVGRSDFFSFKIFTLMEGLGKMIMFFY